MRGKRTEAEFTAKARAVHGDKYDYSASLHFTGKMSIKCPEHGFFDQRADHHLAGAGCPACLEMKGLTMEDYETLAHSAHGGRYSYRRVQSYRGSTKVEIFCPEHGFFKLKPMEHLTGVGCPHCDKAEGRKKFELGRYSKEKQGFIYFIKIKGSPYVKIGITNDAELLFKRIRLTIPLEFEPITVIETRGDIAQQLIEMIRNELNKGVKEGLCGWPLTEDTVYRLIGTCEAFRTR